MKPVRDLEYGNRDQWGQPIEDWYDDDGFPIRHDDDEWSDAAIVEQERVADLEDAE